MTTKVNRAFTTVLLASFCLLQAAPAFAQFTGAGAQATDWVVELLTPVIPLAVLVVGILAWAGRVNWAWFIGAMVGTALFFGRDQVVTLFRSWFGA